MNTIHKYFKDYTKYGLSVAAEILPFIRSYKSPKVNAYYHIIDTALSTP
jgi:hypothetical protein